MVGVRKQEQRSGILEYGGGGFLRRESLSFLYISVGVCLGNHKRGFS